MSVNIDPLTQIATCGTCGGAWFAMLAPGGRWARGSGVCQTCGADKCDTVSH